MDKERFFKVYANLPLNVRDQVVVVLDGEPITWRVANLEIVEDTESGRQILEKLANLEII
ncbi:MAG: hypothetical protein A3E37_02735 [Candidatus Andersenbacteria bacterium RIFCSPHIGHO2_12_FULL_46_9]|jgi:hypothetical protein|nr:MAG: hypothetical protein UW94_C0007G0045 [Parcubacteria group bacterium GW2011_GWA2_45_14]OGY33040.1 MAG: hypothetical protein A3B76_01345 [Candidatus Andersenbacteria bacterium RIFCSPHIGHO2_02_FULL_46_16]OGY36518.1 MAG: hypothetical protein A3E37_02735 [Candidatus Andersenbacteria bacterium RIFCSPHIGHO2_12_FULL_46_9]OGY37119.1 MAG: hypothetical protein A3I08_02035 [Candidatus Andersenbacteria bacterium RIFCSPLOWO2_02_FULL_46_11]OGY39483.1 MAG: hypothetical protein A3G57_04180 [Candidatus A